MNTASVSHAEASGHVAATRKILVWDVPVRLFHWLMVATFAGAWLTAESERWRLVHVTLGYTMVGLVAFRIIWGLVGTRYARFTSFVRGPRAVASYLRDIFHGQPRRFVGHNPAGAIAIIGLLVLTLATTFSGWATYTEFGGSWFEKIHEAAANIMVALVGAHVLGAIASSWLHRENLVGAMISGQKQGRPEQAARRAWRSVAVLMLVAVFGFWWLQYRAAPAAGNISDGQVTSINSVRHDRAHH
ncbi:MAG: cytochrome b/b6 domain-containing protein [Usitatibacteraceae bacterium]